MSTRMFGKISYIGDVLQCRRACDAYNIAILWPFGSGSEAEIATLLKYLNRDIG